MYILFLNCLMLSPGSTYKYQISCKANLKVLLVYCSITLTVALPLLFLCALLRSELHDSKKYP
jgi:hypothetical protein